MTDTLDATPDIPRLAAVDAGLALVFGATILGQAPVLRSGDPRLQARFLPVFSGDEVVLAGNALNRGQGRLPAPATVDALTEEDLSSEWVVEDTELRAAPSAR